MTVGAVPVDLTYSSRKKPGQPDKYFVYSAKLLGKSWVSNKDSISELEHYKNDFVLVHINDFNEALVVAALFMREFNALPIHVFYDVMDSMLYLDMEEIMKTSNYTREDCINMLDEIYSHSDVSILTKDRWDEPLFYD